jgi:hypothetical protein
MAYTAKIVAARRSESTFVGIIGTQHIDGRIERKIVFGCPIARLTRRAGLERH